MDGRDRASEQLRATRLRVTPQRLAVLEYLSSTESHPTAEQVGQCVNERFPTVSRASVYNVLHSLAQAGLVREVVAGDAVTRYDAKVVPHHHFLCRECGRVEDVAWGVAPAPQSLELGAGRRVERYEIVFHGRCAECATLEPRARKRYDAGE